MILSVPGSTGGSGIALSVTQKVSGKGGDGRYGAGGHGTTGTGIAGYGQGSGGSGAAGAGQLGGAGQEGIVIIYSYS